MHKNGPDLIIKKPATTDSYDKNKHGVNLIKLFWCKFTHTFLLARPFNKL